MDHWAQYEEDDGAPVDRAELRDVQQQLQALLQSQAAMMHMLQVQQAAAQQVQQQAAAPPAAPVPPPGLVPRSISAEKLPEPPSLGSDDDVEDMKITNKQYAIYWMKVQMWIALVEGRVQAERYPALIVNKLKGRAADVVWLGAREALTREGGLEVMKQLLDNLFYGDQASAVSNQVSNVLDFHRSSSMSLREYTTEM